MRLTVAVVSPPGYVHAGAFSEVAESLHHSLLALGHESVIVVGDRFPQDRPAIVLGTNALPFMDVRLPPRSALYNLEQVQRGSPWFTDAALDLLRRHPLVWDYSRRNVAALAEAGVRAALVPIGYVAQMSRIPWLPDSMRDIDVLFAGSPNDRREAVLTALEARGLRVRRLFGTYGAERDVIAARAKIVLNVHYFDARVIEVVRLSYMLANRRFVVSEAGADRAEDADLADGIVFADYAGLADECSRWLSATEKERRLVADAGFRAMASRPATTAIADAVAAAWGEPDDHAAL